MGSEMCIRDRGSRGGWSSQGPTWLNGNAWTDTDDRFIRQGALFKYNQSSGIYLCPADKSTVRDEGQIRRSRSVSMSMYMNFRSNPQSEYYKHCWHRVGDIRSPSPSAAFVFIDEHEKAFSKVLLDPMPAVGNYSGPVHGVGSVFLPRGINRVRCFRLLMGMLNPGDGWNPIPTVLPRTKVGSCSSRDRALAIET